ncbi:MAG TPA: lytic murein transglycosylase [Gaiellaceae bacterium]|nr:lytic murein transglycosylase [Gaiellaceae bacterium]
MKRLAAVGAAALALTGGASAATFVVVSTSSLPSAGTPNAPGAVFVPPAPSNGGAQLSLPALQQLWTGAGAAYGVPWQVLAAINKIESNFGRNMGPSSAGAVGWMQFMPDTWRRWGVDADGNGVADPWTAADAIYAAARYLAASGVSTDLRRGIFAYNHADWYVNEVLSLASLYGAGGTDVVFSLDRLQLAVDDAQKATASASARLRAALRETRTRAAAERRLLDRAAAAPLLSNSLALQRAAARLTLRRVTAERAVSARRATLASARQALALARERSRSNAFVGPAANVLGAPLYSGSYVFPVGGGPSIVSVSHAHHDYPAADIAAPSGAPVYALADGLVVRAYRDEDSRCGIGVTLDTADGQSWTYCHLSYLDDAVTAGARLAAGAPVGLVGSTGHATGPHLHLQLNPTDGYPQDEAWFRALANSAFRWQDEPAPATSFARPAASYPVFTAVAEPVAEFRQDVVFFTR